MQYAIISDTADQIDFHRLRLELRYHTCLIEDGRYNEAETYLLDNLKIKDILLGHEHPDTLTSMAILGKLYQYQGRYKEAEELQIQVLETRKRVLGLEHSDTLHSMHELALTWRANGKAKEAVVLMEDCFRRRESSIGTDHPSTKISLNCQQKWYEEDVSESNEVSVVS